MEEERGRAKRKKSRKRKEEEERGKRRSDLESLVTVRKIEVERSKANVIAILNNRIAFHKQIKIAVVAIVNPNLHTKQNNKT